MEDGNSEDLYTVAILKNGMVVGHVPQELFLQHGGTIQCIVTGNRNYGLGLDIHSLEN